MVFFIDELEFVISKVTWKGGGGREEVEGERREDACKKWHAVSIRMNTYLPLSSRKLGPSVRTCGFEIVTDELFSS